MLTLFTRRQKSGNDAPLDDSEVAVAEHANDTSPSLDEDTLKKNIAAKLRNYRPIEREANFTGPKFYNS